MMLKTMAPRKAGRNPLIANPGTIAAASFSMRALITNQNSPTVRIVKGKVTTFRINPMVALTIPTTTDARSADQKLSISKPGTIRVTRTSASVLRSQFSNQVCHECTGLSIATGVSEDKRFAG